jgi:hypothetical protein
VFALVGRILNVFDFAFAPLFAGLGGLQQIAIGCSSDDRRLAINSIFARRTVSLDDGVLLLVRP